MISLRLHDKNFILWGDGESSSKYRAPVEVTWLRDGPNTPITVYTDWFIPMASQKEHGIFKIAWILEPEPVLLAVGLDSYDYVRQHYDDFDLVLTHQSSLLECGPKVVLYPSGMTWVSADDWKRHAKTRDVSIISSALRITDGHKLRHEVIAAAGERLEVYGHGYRPIEHKIEGLAPFRFSVVIENTRSGGWYFTEKIVDCFATYTVPIYHGCPRIEEFFDTSGIIIADNEESLLAAIKMVRSDGEKIYASMDAAMQRNHAKANDVAVAEDWIVRNILRPRGLV